MIAPVSPSAPVKLAGCQVGANPIIWSNDDFSNLAGDLPLEVILREMAAAGFAGTELGHAYPRNPAALREALDRHHLKLIGGWHSSHLAANDYAAEEKNFQAHLALLKSLNAPVIIVAECTRCLHGAKDTALGYGDDDRPRLDEAEWQRVSAGLGRFAALAAEAGLRLVYHHHMGTVIQTEAELDRLLADVPAMDLLFDSGHLAFAGIDPLAVLQRHGARVAHVHLKSLRREVAERARRERWSFYRAVVEGVFTIPGEGVVDFPAIFAGLARQHYRGWLVVEAEEDPVRVPALPKALRARAYVRNHAGV